jgi:hypothetical protein
MGAIMDFTLKDYINLQANNGFFFPKNFLPYINIDKKKYIILEDEFNSEGLKISETFEGLRLRTGQKYFRKVYPAQSSALNFSESSFPAYRFLMSDVLTDDWLAIVDFHKKFSRDHALHQPLTSYIVFKLLGGGTSSESLKVDSGNLLDLCVDQILNSPKAAYLKEYLRKLDLNSDLLIDNPLSREIWKNLFYETAMVSAIFHDIGYPWQYINRLNKSLNISNFNLKQLPSNVKYIQETFKNRLIMHPFHGYNSSIFDTPCNWDEKLSSLISNSLSQTHGFCGALGFLYLNDIIRKYPYSTSIAAQHLCIEWAALGIMMHDMKGIYWGKNKNNQPENDFLRLEFNKDPLSCIITLADVIQDFERPTVNFSKEEDDCIFKYDFSCESTSLELIGDTLEIKYFFKDDDDRIKSIDFKKNDEKEYFDTDYGYVDLSSIGIKKVKLSCEKST